TSPVQRLDDGDPGFVTVGEWTTVTGQGFQGDVRVSNPGQGDGAVWAFTGLVPGTYRVAAPWAPGAGRATDAPYLVFRGGTVVSAVRVNQQQAPGDFIDAGVGWQYLGGPVNVTGGTLSVLLADLADGPVVADAVRLELVAADGSWLSLAPMPSQRQEVSTAVL